MKTIVAFIGVLIFAITIAKGADNDNPRPLTIVSHTSSQFAYEDPATRIILGKVTRVTPPPEQQDGFPINLAYDVIVITEFAGKIAEGQPIIVRGRIEANETASGIRFIPLKVGDTFLMAVGVTSVANQFDNLGYADLPIGIAIPQKIPAKDVAAIRTALHVFGNMMKTPSRMINVDEAQSLISKANGNFFVWALGVSGICLDGTEQDGQTIGKMYGGSEIKISQVLWMDTCLERLFPEETRPSCQQRHDFLITYLVRQADFIPP